MYQRLMAVLVLLSGVLALACASSSAKPADSKDYYRSLGEDEVFRLMISCLRDGSGWCQGKSAAVYSHNRSGPDFDPYQSLTLLDWKFYRAAKNTGALQAKMRDDGIIYDTTVNIDSLVFFGKKGITGMRVEKVYGGDWGFSDGFAVAVLVAGVAATALADSADTSDSSPPSNTEGGRKLFIGSWGSWITHSSGGRHREAWVQCPSGLDFEVEEHLGKSGKHWFQRDAGAVLLPKHHDSLQNFIEVECGEGSGYYDHDRRSQ